MADKPAFDPNASYTKPAFDPSADYSGATSHELDIPDAAQQAKQQLIAKSGLAPTKRVLQQTMGGVPQYVDVPADQADQFERAGKAGYQTGGKIGATIASVPGIIAAPVAAVGGIAGGIAGGKLARAGAEKLGAGEDVADVAEGVGNLAGGVAGGTLAAKSGLQGWLSSSKSLGAKMLNYASQKVGNNPVELSPKTNELVEEIMTLGKRGGGTPPQVIRDLVERLGPNPNAPAGANEGPLTYNEARDFQSSASGKLSPDEFSKLKGRMKSLVPQFAKSFAADVQATADAGGAGQQHAMGMAQYAQASAKERALESVTNMLADKYVRGGVAVGATEELLRHFLSQKK